MSQDTKQIICKNKQYIIFFAVEFHSQDHSAIVYSKEYNKKRKSLICRLLSEKVLFWNWTIDLFVSGTRL